MRNFLFGMVTAIALMAAAAAWVWHYRAERLPQEWRRQNPNSTDYMPTLYRWRDAQGRIQVTDKPPADRPFEAVRIDPNRNMVPSDRVPRELGH